MLAHVTFFSHSHDGELSSLVIAWTVAMAVSWVIYYATREGK